MWLVLLERDGRYGSTLKEVIQEKYDEGIMSVIDFTLKVDKKKP